MKVLKRKPSGSAQASICIGVVGVISVFTVLLFLVAQKASKGRSNAVAGGYLSLGEFDASTTMPCWHQGYQNLAYMRTFVHVHNKYVRSAELVQWETQVPAWLWLHGVCMGRWACMAAWDLHGQVGLHGCMGFAWAGGPAWLHKVCMGSWTCMAAWRLHGQMGLHDCMESHVHHVQYFVPRTY